MRARIVDGIREKNENLNRYAQQTCDLTDRYLNRHGLDGVPFFIRLGEDSLLSYYRYERGIKKNV